MRFTEDLIQGIGYQFHNSLRPVPSGIMYPEQMFFSGYNIGHYGLFIEKISDTILNDFASNTLHYAWVLIIWHVLNTLLGMIIE